MSSQTGSPNPRRGAALRAELIEAGIRLLEQDGPEALQTRRVVAAVGTSTMAVYTHFGGMTGLLGAVVAEAFSRFGAALATVAATDDPVADFLVMGAAYRGYALANPQRYRLMFGLTAPHTEQSPPICDFTADSPVDAVGAETFEQLVGVVERMIAGEHLRADPPRQVAARLWALIHGAVLLEMTGNLGPEGHSQTTVLLPATIDLLVGMGAAREHVEQSALSARRTISQQ